MKLNTYTYHPSNKFILIFLICLLSGFSFQLSAQIDTTGIDSLDETTYLDAANAHVEFFIGDSIGLFHAPDTTIDLFQKFNPVRRQEFEYTYLGNLGASYEPRLFEFNRYIGFDYGRHEHDLYLDDINELKYYRTNVPFTDLYYVIGTNSEQYFSVRHTRNVGKDFNFSIGLDKISSEGYYQHMKQNVLNVDATIWYKTKNEFYSVYAGGIHSENKNDENGGINNDTLFTLPFPNLAEPYRNYAFTEWGNWQGQITQQLNFGRKEVYQINDSTTGTYQSPKLYLRHTFGVHNYKYKFEDLYDSLFYSILFSDDDTLRDLSDVDGFYNRVSIGNSTQKKISRDSSILVPFNWEVYGLQQYHEISDQSGELISRNLIAGASVKGNGIADSLIDFNANGSFDIIPGDYEMKANARLTKFIIQPGLGIKIGRYFPTEIQQHYYGFRFRWDTPFVPVKSQQLFLNLHMPVIHLELNASMMRVTNYIYFENFYPAQFNSQISIAQIELKKNFVLGDFHLNNSLAYQSVSAIIDDPVYLANISWYFQKHLFHSALFTQIGFDAWYASDFNGHHYNMITGQFDENNLSAENDQLSFDPVFDIFANFDIRTFRFFLKVDNITQGLFSKGYYEAPNYPMQPRGVKLGVNWMLFY